MNLWTWLQSLFCGNHNNKADDKVEIQDSIIEIPEPESPKPDPEPKKKKPRKTTQVQDLHAESNILWERAQNNVKNIGRAFKSLGDLELKNGKAEDTAQP